MYRCPKCNQETETDWCVECECTSDHTCEFQKQRHKEIIYGDDNHYLY